MKRVILIMTLLLSVILVACGGDDDGEDNDSDNADSDNGAAQTVLDYIEAKVASDENGITNLICSEMEADIQREVSSLASVSPELSEAASCAVDGEADGYTMVTCDGEIVATYGTEIRELPLGTYRAVEEDGEWRWCGEG